MGYEVVGEVSETELGALTMLKLPGDAFVAIELVHDILVWPRFAVWNGPRRVLALRERTAEPPAGG